MKKAKRLFAAVLVLALLALVPISVKADNGCPVDGCDGVHETYDASHPVTLTIHHFVMPKNHPDIPGTGLVADTTGWVPMSEVQYTITQTLDDDRKPVQGQPFSYTGETQGDGSLAVPGTLEHGVYELTAVLPLNVADNADNAVITLELPMTNPEGTGFIYDVHIYPKNALLKETLEITGERTSAYTAFNGAGVDFAVTTTLPVGIGRAAYFVMAIPMGDDFAAPALSGLTVQPAGIPLVAEDYTATYESGFDEGEPATSGTPLAGGTGGTLAIRLTTAGLAKLATARAAEPAATLRADYTAALTLDSGAGKAEAAAGVYYENAQGVTEYDVYDVGEEPFVYTGRIRVAKVDGAENDVTLSGATFVLRRAAGGGYEYYARDDATGAVTWQASKANATTLTTGPDGLVTFTGLADGTYGLEETVAPTGYNRMRGEEAAVMDIQNTSVVSVDKTIANYKGLPLPLTGGPGTLLLTLGGFLVMVLVLALAVRRRKVAKRG